MTDPVDPLHEFELEDFEAEVDEENGGTGDQLDYNRLHELGNRAIALGLIAGHGYHRGQYELLRQGQVVTLSPQEALTYLQTLIQSVESTDG